MINSAKIKDRMKSLDLTQKDVADALNIAVPTACQKINGVRPMDLDEAKVLAGVRSPGGFFCSILSSLLSLIFYL